MTINLDRYRTDQEATKTVSLHCSDCERIIGTWHMRGAWPIVVEQRKYEHAERIHGEQA